MAYAHLYPQNKNHHRSHWQCISSYAQQRKPWPAWRSPLIPAYPQLAHQLITYFYTSLPTGDHIRACLNNLIKQWLESYPAVTLHLRTALSTQWHGRYKPSFPGRQPQHFRRQRARHWQKLSRLFHRLYAAYTGLIQHFSACLFTSLSTYEKQGKSTWPERRRSYPELSASFPQDYPQA